MGGGKYLNQSKCNSKHVQMMKIQVYLYHVFFLSECSKWSLININYNFKRVSITKSAYYYFLTFENINLLDNLAYIISRTLRFSFYLLIAGNVTKLDEIPIHTSRSVLSYSFPVLIVPFINF